MNKIVLRVLFDKRFRWMLTGTIESWWNNECNEFNSMGPKKLLKPFN